MTSEPLDPNRTRVIIAGCHEYSNLESLPSVKNNTRQLHAVLTDPLIGGIAPQSCHLLEQPETPGILLDCIYDAAEQCTDTFIFYYAGHGLTHFHNGDLSLALPSTVAHRPHTSVRFDDVRHAILAARTAPRKIVILDCCFSGRAMTGTMTNAADLAARSEIEGTYILAAAAETKLAVAPLGEEYTAFTGELISILEKGVPGGPKHLSMGLVYEHLSRRLAARSRPVPQQRNRNAGSGIPLARNVRFSPENKPGAVDDIIDYMQTAAKSDVNPDALRGKMNSPHIPYSRRLRSASQLAYYDPSLTVECIDTIEHFLTAPDISGLDTVAIIKEIGKLDASRLTWAHKLLSEIARGQEGSRSYTTIVREHACHALGFFGFREEGARSYINLFEDYRESLSYRITVARATNKCFPESKLPAVKFLWRTSKDSKVHLRDRLEALRAICELHPKDISAASAAIDELTKSQSQ
ncbi:caspase family protein [Streptomyces sp. BRA346]|uniref:caspase family protein n=1 Tax=Streptomyces sp. BRA346 TaxID=2878199 RepID=UPI004062E408